MRQVYQSVPNDIKLQISKIMSLPTILGDELIDDLKKRKDADNFVKFAIAPKKKLNRLKKIANRQFKNDSRAELKQLKICLNNLKIEREKIKTMYEADRCYWSFNYSLKYKNMEIRKMNYKIKKLKKELSELL
jgi:hypothetical protein